MKSSTYKHVIKRAPFAAETDEEKRIVKNFHRIARERTEGLIRACVNNDEPLSMIGLCCYAQGFCDLTEAMETKRRKDEASRLQLDGEGVEEEREIE